MNQPRTAPYGTWKSPVTPAMTASGSIAISQIRIDGEDIYWVENRPSEGGRSVVMRATENEPEQITPPGYNVRTAVHEYGGGAYTVDRGTVYFSQFTDGRIYRQERGAEPQPLTPAVPMRYADLTVDSRRNRLICVREDHTLSDLSPANTIVAVDLASGDITELVAGADFYSALALSPDGGTLAWINWDLPDMPWDGSELWTGTFGGDGTIAERERIGGSRTESITQPEWSPDGTLHFVSDRTGWWNIYRRSGGTDQALWDTEAEFGDPLWTFRMSAYAFLSPERIICRLKRNGVSSMAVLDTNQGEGRQIDLLPYTEFSEVRALGQKAVVLAGSPTKGRAIIRIDPAGGSFQTVREVGLPAIGGGYISVPQSIEFPTEDGRTAHAFFYAPTNSDFIAPQGELPPLMVISHGGPTGSTSTIFDPKIQYWTSRGIAVLDVNYGGSTGYGRAYRERLNGNWGVVDVDDCVNGALHMVRQGKADRDRLIIRGGSAGGYTTLAALTFRDIFKAGASYYGISDLEALEKDSHKFESRYNNSLIGPYPQQRDLYRERSPIHFIERISCPIILFQGLEDMVVPPNQAEMMFEGMKAKGLPVAYLPLAGEQHGFRKAENIIRTLEAEFYFYSRIFGFRPADPIEPVVIENLPEAMNTPQNP